MSDYGRIQTRYAGAMAHQGKRGLIDLRDRAAPKIQVGPVDPEVGVGRLICLAVAPAFVVWFYYSALVLSLWQMREEEIRHQTGLVFLALDSFSVGGFFEVAFFDVVFCLPCFPPFCSCSALFDPLVAFLVGRACLV